MLTMQPLHTLDSPVRTFTRDLCLSAALSHCRSLSLSVDKTVLLNAEQLCAVVAVLPPLAVCSTDLLSYLVYQVKSARLI